LRPHKLVSRFFGGKVFHISIFFLIRKVLCMGNVSNDNPMLINKSAGNAIASITSSEYALADILFEKC